jgi:hypothetical protein
VAAPPGERQPAALTDRRGLSRPQAPGDCRSQWPSRRRGRRARTPRCHLLTNPGSAYGADSPAFVYDQVPAIGLPVHRVATSASLAISPGIPRSRNADSRIGARQRVARTLDRMRGRRLAPRRRPERARSRGKAGTSDWLLTSTQPRRGRRSRSWRGARLSRTRGERPELSAEQGTAHAPRVAGTQVRRPTPSPPSTVVEGAGREIGELRGCQRNRRQSCVCGTAGATAASRSAR